MLDLSQAMVIKLDEELPEYPAMQLVINLGCLRYKMTPEEVLTAVTLNAAAAVGRAGRIGSLEPGKAADLVIWDAPDLNYLCYRMGSNLAQTVVKNGQIVQTPDSPDFK